jgi:DNA polymerase-3 subunit alpha (Gram-positive type)
MLQDLTGLSIDDMKLDDPKTMSIFSSCKALGVKEEDIGTKFGTLAIPEFGTEFVRQMLDDTLPKTFAELVRISGLSHGTDVWLNNAQQFIREGKTTLANVISVRDDIMNFLIDNKIPAKTAFSIMENVRKGKGLKEDQEKLLRDNKIPEWYIESCKKIKYMFPKAHAAAYVLMAFRVAFFKVHYPLEFYATYFTIKSQDTTSLIFTKGISKVNEVLLDIRQKEDKTQKDLVLYSILEVAREAIYRGIEFLPVDLYKSEVKTFTIPNKNEKKLLCPFVSLPGLGEQAALSVLEARELEPFSSIEDLKERTKLNKNNIEDLRSQGSLEGLPNSSQLELFNFFE